MTLRLRVGRKGYIILPKALREAVGIDEGDEVVVEIRDGILIKPAKKNIDTEEVKRRLREHAAKLKNLQERREPGPGEAATSSLEEEFEQ
ncbi:hypothetical protein PYJP_11970 [Pyrofollis japonicus]|uniref:AbrB/MazE/SpoVT family DNA-binding domain-containing protein n=1 Tax=Pyrofollis japonicus TaxID=3060460 RepID=UPI00295C17B0|nr:AbrB/MazE/SpoVT family DNA-binding domain-containing protein [Pyrofollis japonicus]BEP17845.1 hypothetical protein PYJP_11970 [Pyrofollis japonicus]